MKSPKQQMIPSEIWEEAESYKLHSFNIFMDSNDWQVLSILSSLNFVPIGLLVQHTQDADIDGIL